MLGPKPAAKPTVNSATGTHRAVVLFAHFAGQEQEHPEAPGWATGIFDVERPGSFSHFDSQRRPVAPYPVAELRVLPFVHLSGRVTDRAEQPASGVAIRALGSTGSYTVRTTITDQQGTLTLSSGNYQVWARLHNVVNGIEKLYNLGALELADDLTWNAQLSTAPTAIEENGSLQPQLFRLEQNSLYDYRDFTEMRAFASAKVYIQPDLLVRARAISTTPRLARIRWGFSWVFNVFSPWETAG